MDSTVSDLDATINLDESEWIPSDNFSDDNDSIEIVGETCQTVRRCTRSTRSTATAVLLKSLPSRPKPTTAKRGTGAPRSGGRKRSVVNLDNSGTSDDSFNTSSAGSGGSGTQKKRKLSTDEGDFHSSHRSFKKPSPAVKSRGVRGRKNDIFKGPPLGSPINTNVKFTRKLSKVNDNLNTSSPLAFIKENKRLSSPDIFSLNDSDIFIDLPDISDSVTNNTRNRQMKSVKSNLDDKNVQSSLDIKPLSLKNTLVPKKNIFADVQSTNSSGINNLISGDGPTNNVPVASSDLSTGMIKKIGILDTGSSVKTENSIDGLPSISNSTKPALLTDSSSSNKFTESNSSKKPSIKSISSDKSKTIKRVTSRGTISKIKSPRVTPRRSIPGKSKISVTKLSSKPPKLLKTVKRISKSIDPDIEVLFEWDPANVIAERQGVSQWQARQVISLLDQECTLPFIARYRRETTGNMDIEKLRDVHNAYTQLKEVKQKVSKVIQTDASELTEDNKLSLLNATTVQEVKVLTASLRLGSKGKRTLADRARQLSGMTDAADTLLNNVNCAEDRMWVQKLVDTNIEGKRNVEEVETGLKHIISDVISKDPKMLGFMKTGLKGAGVMMESCRARKVKAQEKAALKKPKKVVVKRASLGGKKPRLVAKKTVASEVAPDVVSKFQNYFNFSCPAWRAQPHAILAMNRGEQLGILTVKVSVPSEAYSHFVRYCAERWVGQLHFGPRGPAPSYRRTFLLDNLPDCWDRLVLPAMQSWVRGELGDAAELASIQVFATNLRRLLLTPPVRANTVLALDPGFTHGCKVAVVERKGKVLAVDTIYPFGARQASGQAVGRLRQLIIEYHCEIVCIGNGTACREAEAWLSDLIKDGAFEPVNVQYTIIDESGASQYSVTPEAKIEFPDMDINHISAVSLARRLQDPLLEYVKVPPMHLGVGMYQHDVSNKLLTISLDSVVMECVSFVGVDINVASELVLRKVSGLNKSRAAAIVKHREDQGTFRTREELKKVKGIGPVSFQQCAGFIRIVPQTLRQKALGSRLTALCPLDSTTVHPESYDSANKIILLAGVNVSDVGTEAFTSKIKKFIHKEQIKELSTKCICSESTLNVILESLYRPMDFDFRAQFEKPLFRKGVTSVEQLKNGEILTGSVRNVTSFGAFVDIGVGFSGLLHNTQMGGRKIELGNTVVVQVLNVEVARKRIALMLKEVVG